MSRILHLIASDSIGEPERQLLRHAKNTRHTEYEIVLGSFQDQLDLPEFLAAANRSGIETVSIPGGVRPGLVDDLAGYLRTYSIDLICTHENRANVVGHFAAKHAQVPWVPFVHGIVDEPVSLYERLEHNLLVRTDSLVCTSATQAREFAKLRRGRPAPVVIPNVVLAAKEFPIGSKKSGETHSTGSGDFVFGTVGPLNRENGHRFLMDAFASLAKTSSEPSMELLIVGDGPEETSLRTQARRLGIEARVSFAGHQNNPASWMKGMDCLIHPALVEDPGNSILDGMLLGVPVIASSLGTMQDVVQNAQSGLLVEAGSAAALMEAMKKIVLSPGMRTQLAANAQRRVQRDFSPAHQKNLLESVYENALGGAFTVDVEESANVVA